MNADQTAQGGPNMDLPAPVVPSEQHNGVAPVVEQQGSERNPELLPSQPGIAAVPTPVATSPVVSGDPVATSVPSATNLSPSASAMPMIADDNDLIEKEWVEKAKAIVNQTKNDPHTQNQQINGMKADYLKKRYNKDIPVA